MNLIWQTPVKVIGISSKDRSAIFPAGRMANGAYWFDVGTVTSSAAPFIQAIPEWVTKFNESRVVDQWAGKNWTPLTAKGDKAFLKLPAEGEKSYYNPLDRTPFHNDLLELFAEAAIEGEQLGSDDVTDVLSVSFSANDRVGHAVGPDAPQVRDIAVWTDRTIGRVIRLSGQEDRRR